MHVHHKGQTVLCVHGHSLSTQLSSQANVLGKKKKNNINLIQEAVSFQSECMIGTACIIRVTEALLVRSVERRGSSIIHCRTIEIL